MKVAAHLSGKVCGTFSAAARKKAPARKKPPAPKKPSGRKKPGKKTPLR